MLRLASFEWRLLRADATLRLLALVVVVVLGYGVFNGTRWVRFQESTLRRVQDEATQRLATHKETMTRLAAGDTAGIRPWTNPAVPSNAGGTLVTQYATLPPAPLASFAVGQSDLYPYYTRVSTRSKQSFIVNDEIENPVNLLAGRFDLAFVVIYLLPLLILAVSYNLVSGEREQGTLALVLSQPTDARRVLGSKLLARIVMVLGLALGLVLVTAIFSGVSLGGTGVIPRLGLWMLVVSVYVLFWFAAALAVNAMRRSSATNAVILLGAWLLVVVIVPSLYNVAITTLQPSPSRVELTTALRAATNEAQEQGSALLQKYYLDHPEMMGGGTADMGNFAARSVAVQEAVEESMGPALADFDRRLEAQQALADRYRFLSPALVMQAALFDLSGTSVHRYRHFQRQVDTYHQAWRDFFFPKIFARTTLSTSDLDALPRFAFQEEAATDVARRVWPGLLALLLPAVVLAWWAMRGFTVRQLAASTS